MNAPIEQLVLSWSLISIEYTKAHGRAIAEDDQYGVAWVDIGRQLRLLVVGHPKQEKLLAVIDSELSDAGIHE